MRRDLVDCQNVVRCIRRCLEKESEDELGPVREQIEVLKRVLEDPDPSLRTLQQRLSNIIRELEQDSISHMRINNVIVELGEIEREVSQMRERGFVDMWEAPLEPDTPDLHNQIVVREERLPPPILTHMDRRLSEQGRPLGWSWDSINGWVIVIPMDQTIIDNRLRYATLSQLRYRNRPGLMANIAFSVGAFMNYIQTQTRNGVYIDQHNVFGFGSGSVIRFRDAISFLERLERGNYNDHWMVRP